jgi:CelD/BcsL family acetyltransferase involved in cellulose biosynthesis
MHAPLSPAVRVEWRTLAALGDVADQWRALAGRALEPNVFYGPAFLPAATPVFGSGAGAALAWLGGRLIGLFPGRIERRGPLSRVAGWTHPFAPLGTPLLDREQPEQAIAAWLDHFGADPGMPDLLLLPLAPEQGAFAAALEVVLARSGRRQAQFARHGRAVLNPGAQRDGYLELAMSGGKRKELRRQRRRLEEFAPVTFTSTQAPAEIDTALKDFLVIEASGWKGLAGTAAVNDPAVHDFVRGAVACLAADGHARVDRMFLNGRAIAATVMLRAGDTAWLWKIAYSEGLGRYSPGVQLAVQVTEQVLAEPSIARVDSCAVAGHPMIDHIWRERLALCDRLIALRPGVLPFALACKAERVARATVAAARTLRDRVRGR